MIRAVWKELMLLILVFGMIWGIFYYFPIFPEPDVDISIEKEEQLGDLLIEGYLSMFQENKDTLLDSVVYAIQERLMEGVGLTDFDYKIHILESPVINAGALPGGHIIIFTGLIGYCDKPEELAAVMAHEIAHVEKRHVLKRLIKEIGMQLLFGNDQIIIDEIGRTVTSTVFDRQQEREADEVGMKILEKCNISPRAIASLFRRLGRKSGKAAEVLEIISTHPHNNSRVKASLEYELAEDFKEVAFDFDWELIRDIAGRQD